MHDMNFFAPFHAGAKGGKQGSLLNALLVLVIGAIILLPIALFGFTYMAQNKTAQIVEILNTPENKAIMVELDKKQDRLNAIQKAVPELKNKDKALKSAEWFNEELLQIVVDTLPKQVRATGILLTKQDVGSSALSSSALEIVGTATDKPAVAELEYNLRKTGRFNNVFVSYLIDNEGVLNFSVKFDAKDVSAQ